MLIDIVIYAYQGDTKITMVIEQNNYLESVKKLEDSNLGEHERNKLRNDIALGRIKLIAGYSHLINGTLALTKTPLSQAIGTIYPTKDISPGLFKATTVNARLLGGVFGAISIMDGCMSMQVGLTKSGTTKVVYLVAGGLQLISGLVVLGQVAGLITLTGPLGIAIFVITLLVGLVAGLITYWFRDKSEEWDEMERWFNRCLFGQHDHLNGLPPYRATFESMALAINDYMIAKIGLQATLQLNHEQAYYIDEMQKNNRVINSNLVNRSIEINTKELYISVEFPDYNEEISDFDITLRITRFYKSQQANLRITKNPDKALKYPIIQMRDSISSFILRKFPLKVEIDTTVLYQKNIGLNEFYGFTEGSKQEKRQNYFKIYYKVGEILITDIKEFYLQVAYWPKGKVIHDENNNSSLQLPLIKNYKLSKNYNNFFVKN